ncbi:hypothetical protein BSG18_49790 [Pseudomonas ogarae]|nr:hypothetical protein BSG18_49790 [Pseudomonas ogarae]
MHRQKVDDITNGESVMVEKLTRFDAATYLNTYEEMVAYLVPVSKRMPVMGY